MACRHAPTDALMMTDFYDGSDGSDAVLITCVCAAAAAVNAAMEESSDE